MANIIKPSFVEKLGFFIQKTDISTQKIDNSKLEIFGIILAFFW